MVFRVRYGSALAVSLLGLVLSACDGKTQVAMPAPGPVEVGVMAVTREHVSLEAGLPGRINAFRKAEVRPQVSGIIQKRLFVEGSEIKAAHPYIKLTQPAMKQPFPVQRQS